MRVIIVHISVDGNWTVSRSLRQQCDDIVEIDAAQLRPYAELIAGAEPARYSEQYAAGAYGGKPLANGHATGAGGGHAGLPSGSSASHPASPAMYTAPVVAEYQPPAQPAAEYPPPARPAARQSSAPPEPEPAPAAGPAPAEPNARGMHPSHAAASPQQQQSPPGAQPAQPPVVPPGSAAQPSYSAPAPGSFADPAGSGGQATSPARDPASAHQGSPAGASAASGPAGPQAASSPSSGQRATGPRAPYAPEHPGGFAEPAGSQFSSAPPEQFSSAPPSLPARRGVQANGLQPSGPQGQRGPLSPRPTGAPRSHQAQRPVAAPSAGYIPQQGPYGAQMSGPSAAGAPSSAGLSLADTVQAAHSEGFEFGESVARDAPGLWLEAVLARKPRMPSDLEARLLQGSALPIDSLLHDEVRHALRRGFWDALERSRR